MCGIAGLLGARATAKVLQSMLDAQKHRGPDFTGSFFPEPLVALGHNRLSIIDLSESANQPFLSACGRYVMVFNGEIYNYLEIKQQLRDYPFRTQSDTEVLLAGFIQWGTGVLHKLNGMFSFAIWDQQAKKLFAARDRFGVKPFYYAMANGQFYFASEIKALFAAGVARRKNEKVWANYFVYGSYGLPNETFWRGVEQLPAGFYLEVGLQSPIPAKPVQWYNFVERVGAVQSQSVASFHEEYESLLADSISLRFRADVPLGMSVSGGLDSSLLIALVSQNLSSDRNIEAFTFYSNDARYDELPWVHELMAKTRYPLNKVLLQWQEVPALVSQVSHYQDEPFGGFPTLAYSLIFKEARAKGIPVLLDGQGMDEAWAGYDYYHNNSGHTVQGVSSSPVRPEVLCPSLANLAEKEQYPQPFGEKLKDLQYRDLFFTKIPRALRFNDRVSMQHGIELREPFLDYRLVELAFAQQDSMKIQGGQPKWLLRNIAQKYLGASIAFAPKRPLQTPQREWISNELRGYFNDQINLFSKLDYVDAAQVAKIWKEYCMGSQDNSFYIWQWLNTAAMEGEL